MATRPVFLAAPDSTSLVSVVQVDFAWHSGFAMSQKVKNRDAMHSAARAKGIDRVLEVSSKSDNPLGRSLSAFNLIVSVPKHGEINLESAFQGSKVFKGFGPCHDLYALDARSAKSQARLRDSGDLLAFDFNGSRWDLEPKTAFYDWLYIRALSRLPKSSLLELCLFSAFTDIEFNPAKSFNCQARSCALAVVLLNQGRFEEIAQSENSYRESVSGDWKSNPGRSRRGASQQQLF